MAKRQRTVASGFDVRLDQRRWLEKKALEQSYRLGRRVTMNAIVRALIQKQMDFEHQCGKIWDDDLQIPSPL